MSQGNSVEQVATVASASVGTPGFYLHVSFHPVNNLWGQHPLPVLRLGTWGLREVLGLAQGYTASNDRARIQTHTYSSNSTFYAFSPVTSK